MLLAIKQTRIGFANTSVLIGRYRSSAKWPVKTRTELLVKKRPCKLISAFKRSTLVPAGTQLFKDAELAIIWKKVT